MDKYFLAVSYFENVEPITANYQWVKNIGIEFTEKLCYNAKTLLHDQANRKNILSHFEILKQKENSIIVLFLMGQASKNNFLNGQFEPLDDLQDEYFKLFANEKLLDDEIHSFRKSLHSSNTLYVFVNSCYAGGMEMINILTNSIHSNLEPYIFEFSKLKLFKKNENKDYECDNVYFYNVEENQSATTDDILNLLILLPNQIKCNKPKNLKELLVLMNLNKVQFKPSITIQEQEQIKSI